MILRPPSFKRTDTLLPYPTLFRAARAAPGAADRRDRARRDLDAGLDAADGVRARRLRAPRGEAAVAEPAPERVRPAPDQGHAVPHRGRRLDRGAGRPRGGEERKSVVEGKRVSLRGELGGYRNIK